MFRKCLLCSWKFSFKLDLFFTFFKILQFFRVFCIIIFGALEHSLLLLLLLLSAVGKAEDEVLSNEVPFFCNLLALRENGKSVARVQLPSEEQFAHRIFATVPFEIGKPEAVTEIAEHQLMDAKRQLSIEFRVAVVVAATYCFSYILRRCLCLCDSAIWPSVLCWKMLTKLRPSAL